MAEKNEIMNIMDYEVVDTRSNDIQISGTEIATQLVAVIPNAVAAPFQRYHEVEVKKEVALKTLEYRAKELEHRTMDRDKLCDTMSLPRIRHLIKRCSRCLWLHTQIPIFKWR